MVITIAFAKATSSLESAAAHNHRMPVSRIAVSAAPCQCPGMANVQCGFIVGFHTGTKTMEGIECIMRAVTKNGRFTNSASRPP